MLLAVTLPTLLTFLAATPLGGLAKPTISNSPQVKIKNGTLRGLYLPGFHEEAFLGIPFASPPVGDLRLRHPVPYNQRWQQTRDATVRSPSCPGYAGFDVGLTLGEDCLTVDVVRPAGTSHEDSLPVLVWIYGGGMEGSRVLLRYIANSIFRIRCRWKCRS
jgi:cholinesterase